MGRERRFLRRQPCSLQTEFGDSIYDILLRFVARIGVAFGYLRTVVTFEDEYIWKETVGF